MTDARSEITQLLETYFARQSLFDGDGMLEFWHPEGRMYLVGNQNDFRVVTIEEQVSHIKDAKESGPDLKVEFVLDNLAQAGFEPEFYKTDFNLISDSLKTCYSNKEQVTNG